jgi:hypothetical protein
MAIPANSPKAVSSSMAILWGKSVKDAALGNRAMTTLPNQRIQFPA